VRFGVWDRVSTWSRGASLWGRILRPVVAAACATSVSSHKLMWASRQQRSLAFSAHDSTQQERPSFSAIFCDRLDDRFFGCLFSLAPWFWYSRNSLLSIALASSRIHPPDSATARNTTRNPTKGACYATLLRAGCCVLFLWT
jgi:hypothetical protein